MIFALLVALCHWLRLRLVCTQGQTERVGKTIALARHGWGDVFRSGPTHPDSQLMLLHSDLFLIMIPEVLLYM